MAVLKGNCVKFGFAVLDVCCKISVICCTFPTVHFRLVVRKIGKSLNNIAYQGFIQDFPFGGGGGIAGGDKHIIMKKRGRVIRKRGV